MTKHLSEIAKKEKIASEQDALELIAIHANGSFRDGVSLLDQLSGLSEKITAKLVESVLGMAEKSRIETIVSALDSGDVATLVGELDALQAAGISSVVVTDQLSRALSVKAKEKHQFYQLLDELTYVAKAHDPQLKLIATLVRYAKPVTPRTVATQTLKVPSFAARPAALRAAVAPKTTPKAVMSAIAEPKKAISKPPVGQFDWAKTLTVIKKHHAPLFSVLSRADVDFDEELNQLTLRFTYVLHRKKLENPTYRKQLGSVIHDLYGLDPEIIIKDKNSPKPALDSAAEAVAAIMGGGEPISGTI
jgi:DNA polymerase-3 subunit gamma/tau